MAEHLHEGRSVEWYLGAIDGPRLGDVLLLGRADTHCLFELMHKLDETRYDHVAVVTAVDPVVRILHITGLAGATEEDLDAHLARTPPNECAAIRGSRSGNRPAVVREARSILAAQPAYGFQELLLGGIACLKRRWATVRQDPGLLWRARELLVLAVAALLRFRTTSGRPGYTCSGLVAAAYDDAGYPLDVPLVPPGSILAWAYGALPEASPAVRTAVADALAEDLDGPAILGRLGTLCREAAPGTPVFADDVLVLALAFYEVLAKDGIEDAQAWLAERWKNRGASAPDLRRIDARMLVSVGDIARENVQLETRRFP